MSDTYCMATGTFQRGCRNRTGLDRERRSEHEVLADSAALCRRPRKDQLRYINPMARLDIVQHAVHDFR